MSERVMKIDRNDKSILIRALHTDDFWNLLDQMPHQSSKARHKPAER